MLVKAKSKQCRACLPLALLVLVAGCGSAGTRVDAQAGVEAPSASSTLLESTTAPPPTAIETSTVAPTATPPAQPPTATPVATVTPSPEPTQGPENDPVYQGTGFQIMIPEGFLVVSSGDDIEALLREWAPLVAEQVDSVVVENAISAGANAEFLAYDVTNPTSFGSQNFSLVVPDLPPPPSPAVLIQGLDGQQVLLPSGAMVAVAASAGPLVAGRRSVRLDSLAGVQVWVLHPDQIYQLNFALASDALISHILDSLVLQ